MILTALIPGFTSQLRDAELRQAGFPASAYASTSNAWCIATRRSGRVAAEPEEMPRPRPRRRCSAEVA